MSISLDLQKPAQALLEYGMAKIDDGVALHADLLPFTTIADRTTLIGIARLLLIASPPLWLKIAVGESGLRREYIPAWDLLELEWMDPDLNGVLTEVRSMVRDPAEDELRSRIGDAAELFIFSALSHIGLKPLHVAKISDAFGYDIECRTNAVDRIEVKAASESTQGAFHITRNEYEMSIKFGRQLRLVQVTFFNRAFLAQQIDSTHVKSVRELRQGSLQQLIPLDTDAFKWTDSALVSAPENAWENSPFRADPEFMATMRA